MQLLAAVAFILISCSLVVQAQNSCLYQNPANHLYYNLAPMRIPAGGHSYNGTDNLGFLYYVNVCGQATEGGCNPASGVCQTNKTSGVATGCGNGAQTFFYAYYPTPSTNGVTIVYQGGQFCTQRGRMSYINIQCNDTLPGPGKLTFVGEDPTYQCAYRINMVSQYGCGFPTEQEALDYIGIPEETTTGGQSINVGWMLILGFATLFLVYVVVGVLIKFKKYDARGLELVPNIGFWRDVPYIIGDGFAFVFSKCTGGRVCGSHTYGGRHQSDYNRF